MEGFNCDAAARPRRKFLDERIKTCCEIKKRKLQGKFARGLDKRGADQQSAKLSHLMKIQQSRSASAPEQSEQFDESELARFLANRAAGSDSFAPKPCAARADFAAATTRAIPMLKKGESVDPGGANAELLQLKPELMASALMALWSECCSFSEFPRQLLQAAVIPLRKKGDERDPKNCHPIIPASCQEGTRS